MKCNCEASQEKFKALDEFIVENKCKDESSLIKVLHHAQYLYGYLPRDVQIHVAEKLSIPAAKVYGVITFYSYFTDQPRGEYVIQVCLGTGCFVKGADKVMESFEQQLSIKSGETTEDKKFTLSGVRCIGACGLAPVVMINDKVIGHVSQDDVASILENYVIDEALVN